MPSDEAIAAGAAHPDNLPGASADLPTSADVISAVLRTAAPVHPTPAVSAHEARTGPEAVPADGGTHQGHRDRRHGQSL